MPGKTVYVVGVGMTKVSSKIIFCDEIESNIEARAGEERTKHYILYANRDISTLRYSAMYSIISNHS